MAAWLRVGKAAMALLPAQQGTWVWALTSDHQEQQGSIGQVHAWRTMALCTVPSIQQQEAQESALLSSSNIPDVHNAASSHPSGGPAYLIMSGQRGSDTTPILLPCTAASHSASPSLPVRMSS